MMEPSMQCLAPGCVPGCFSRFPAIRKLTCRVSGTNLSTYGMTEPSMQCRAPGCVPGCFSRFRPAPPPSPSSTCLMRKQIPVRSTVL